MYSFCSGGSTLVDVPHGLLNSVHAHGKNFKADTWTGTTRCPGGFYESGEPNTVCDPNYRRRDGALSIMQKMMAAHEAAKGAASAATAPGAGPSAPLKKGTPTNDANMLAMLADAMNSTNQAAGASQPIAATHKA
jgi:hypothetical protein